MSVRAEIVSKNDWLRKAGAFLDENDRLHLPMKHIIVPMTHASHCIEQYKESLPLDERVRIIQILALNVRIADKAYFKHWSENLIRVNSQVWPQLFECFNCFKSTLSQNSLREQVSLKLKELSDFVNVKIIHAMESSVMIDPQDFQTAFDYYKCFLELNLMYYPRINNLRKKRCKECERKT